MEHHARAHWRFYQTPTGGSPVEEYLRSLPLEDQAAIAAAMHIARIEGLRVARHIEGDLYELRATGRNVSYRLFFSQEAKFILLALDAIDKRTQRTPKHTVDRALYRLRDWRARGRK